MDRRTLIEKARAPPIAFLIAVAAAASTWVLFAETTEVAWMLSITLFCIVLWILTPIPPAYTGLIGIGLIAVTFSTNLALTGFQKPATWLIGFGLLMGEATRRSGLANWIETSITTRTISESASAQPVRTYRRLLIALSIGGHALASSFPRRSSAFSSSHRSSRKPAISSRIERRGSDSSLDLRSPHSTAPQASSPPIFRTS